MKSKVFRWIGFSLTLILILSLLTVVARYGTGSNDPVEVKDYKAWDPELVDEFASMPVQDGGRIKPFSTWAGFELLSLNGKRSVYVKVGDKKVKLGPVEWALDCMLRPDYADQMEFFQVEDAQILDMIDMKHDEKNRRDRYSFNDLRPHLDQIDKLGQELREKRQKQGSLDPKEDQFMALSSNIGAYLSLRSHLDPVKTKLTDDTSKFAYFSSWVENWSVMQPLFLQQMEKQEMGDKMKATLADFGERVERSSFSELAMMPASDKNQEAWPVRRGWLREYISGKQPFSEDQIKYLRAMETIALAYGQDGEAGLKKAVLDYKAEIKPVLEERGEGKGIASEVRYYKMDYFYRAFIFCIFGFLAVAVGWVAPGSRLAKVCNIIGWIMLIAAILITAAGIAHRSILMGRAPVGNLYDTIPFIAVISLIVLALIELLTKRTVCLGLALFLGILGLALAFFYEQSEGVDHMDPLIAVLRSNYWLTIHVITIVIGYAGGLLTAGLAYVYLFCRWFGLDEGDKKFRRLMTRVVYGGVCFTLFFSLVGTILGGVWANDSWGRFWGWDPKENGALIIVLWNLIILHARLGGYIRDWGLHACAVLGAGMVTFSWWHVNFLGTGLHSYGFTGGAGLLAVYAFYGLNIFIALAAAICGMVESERKKTKQFLDGAGNAPVE